MVEAPLSSCIWREWRKPKGTLAACCEDLQHPSRSGHRQQLSVLPRGASHFILIGFVLFMRYKCVSFFKGMCAFLFELSSVELWTRSSPVCWWCLLPWAAQSMELMYCGELCELGHLSWYIAWDMENFQFCFFKSRGSKCLSLMFKIKILF